MLILNLNKRKKKKQVILLMLNNLSHSKIGEIHKKVFHGWNFGNV
jgi:uncharacterized membrane protein YgcG